MKTLFSTLALFSIACAVSHAQNVALSGGVYGPSAFLGTNSSATLNSFGNAGTNHNNLNDGFTATGTGHDDTFGQADGLDGEVGVVFNTPLTVLVGSVNFYDASFFDGGWFGVNEKGPTGTDDSNPGYLSAAALIAPMLQVTFSLNPASNTSVWTTVSNQNNYVAAMTGSATGAPYGTPISTESTFNLTTPLAGITGIRLVGEVGGYHSQNTGGFLGAYEIQVNEAPEPSTYALVACGMGLLFLGARSMRRLS